MPSNKSKQTPRPSQDVYVGQGIACEFEAIGTKWNVEIFDAQNDQIVADIKKRIDTFDQHYSRFRPDSLVTQMSKTPGVYKLPHDAKPMLDMYQDLYTVTDGQVTPLIGQVLADAGYDAEYSFLPKTVTPPPTWDECLDYDFPILTIKHPVLLDFGALGKGYLVDIIGELLRDRGYEEFIINAGGDILCHGTRTTQIALENPSNNEEAIGVANINNQALCGSAGNRRKWAGYNHIINPTTLASPIDTGAVWVTADTAAMADAMTTALYFAPPEQLQKRYTFNYAIIAHDNSLLYSAGFPATFFDEQE